MKGPSIRRAAVVLAMAASAALSACVVQDQRPTERVVVEKATTEIPQEQLLDVGIMLFDPNIPDDPEEREKQRIFPDVREAEARYMPVVLRDTLEGTGYWGQVRVLPRNVTSMDVYIRGTIIKSTGEELEFDLDVTDVTGRRWFSKTYKGKADTRAYKDIPSRPIDPFEALYHTVANDLIAARRELSSAELVQIRQVSDMRFAADLAPYAFGEYLQQDRDGRYSVVRLPADGDPVAQSMQRVRERDYSLIDTLNEHYSSFNSTMSEPYTNWRKYSYEELEAESEARRQAMTKQILGAVAVVGGIVAGSGASSSAASAAATAAVIGGAYAFKSGFDQRAEVKMHSETVRQLGESFQMEIQPMVVDVEGRTLQLKGSAEEQYAEWRRLLKELYEHETGLPATVGPAT
jgi:cytochrome c556